MTMKAFRVKNASSLEWLTAYPTDAYAANGLGGTGERFNWEVAIQAKRLGRPIVSAAG
jgi:phosphoribosylanthranilate isomerase